MLAQRLISTGGLDTSPARRATKAPSGARARGPVIDEDQEQDPLPYPDRDRRLARLIGPRRQELGCDECCEELSGDVELELAADADAAIPGARTSRRLRGVRGGPRQPARAAHQRGRPAPERPPVGSARGYPAGTSADSALTGKTGANHDAEEDMNPISAVRSPTGTSRLSFCRPSASSSSRSSRAWSSCSRATSSCKSGSPPRSQAAYRRSRSQRGSTS